MEPPLNPKDRDLTNAALLSMAVSLESASRLPVFKTVSDHCVDE